MKIQWKRFPWVTVVLGACAILVGVGFNFFLQVCLPSYKSTVVTVSDVPEINQLLYVEDTEELIIYPWDQFDAGGGQTLKEFVMEDFEGGQENFPEWEKYMQIELDAQIVALLEVSRTDIGSWPDFLGDLRSNEDSQGFQFLTLKSIPVRTLNGYDCVLDAAWSQSMGQCNFFHVYKKDPDPLLDSTVKAANEYLDEIFAAHWTDPYPTVFQGSLPGGIQDDPLLHWLRGVHTYTTLDADELASVMRQKCERIVYRDEILLVYSVDNQHRLVLFYDPMRNVVTGFSCNLFS